jgi:transposase
LKPGNVNGTHDQAKCTGLRNVCKVIFDGCTKIVSWLMSASTHKRPTGAAQKRCVWPDPYNSSFQTEARIMRYELADYEWIAIKPMLPNKPRGVPRVNDRRVLNGIFWVLRSGAPWRDLPEMFGPYTTCYNRFVRWRRAASAHTFIALATKSNGSSTGSNNVVVWQRATTGLQETTMPSSNSHLSGYGWPRVMSPRPRSIQADL